MKANLITFILAVVAFLIGLWLLWFAWEGEPVAAPFTWVGGPTRVETAVEASRFWPAPPERIVTTPANASNDIMWGAARCAALLDAPLLFTARNPNRQRLVETVLKDWGKKKSTDDMLSMSDVTECLSEDQSKGPLLSMLRVPDGPLLLPKSSPEQSWPLSSSFAAAKTPADLPDVAVGLALAAHMANAKTDREVSFVVVPRYFETDVELEQQLRKGRERVTGGLILGQTGVISEDTRALLRQVIRSTDRQGVLGEIRTSLGLLGAALAALLALLGIGAAVRVAPDLAREVVERNEPRLRERIGEMRRRLTPPEPSAPPQSSSSVGSEERKELEEPPTVDPRKLDLLTGLSGQTVTVGLRSGLRVTGTVAPGVPPRVKVLELEAASFSDGEKQTARDDPERSEIRVRVLFEDIELIIVHAKEPAPIDPVKTSEAPQG